jgi:lipid-binding SYLF domain-containing protein
MKHNNIHKISFGLRALALVLSMALLGACTSIPFEQRDDRRAEINRDADETIALLMEKDPEFAEVLEKSAGYMTSRISSATVAVVGGAHGIGVLVNKQTGDRKYLNFKRTELGAGLGLTKFRFLVLAEDAEALENIPSKKYLSGLAADISAGEKGSSSRYNSAGYRVYTISESGASVAATARLTKVSVNTDLTDTGISEIGIPNIGFGIEDGSEPVEQRTWDHKLPFMAQKVIDMGYDLPLPYGLKVLYSDIEQDQILEGLQVGFSGGEKEPFEWVAFENAISFSETYQVIGDAWVLPFLNLFAFVGDVQGDVTLDVFLEGNGLLEQKGIDCSRPGNLVICRALQDQIIKLPVESVFSGTNYGVGFNMAAGWKGFFFTLPVSFSWVDMDTTDVEGGAIISASPRGGYLFKMGNYGNLGLFVGASYLDSDLTAHGSLAVPETDVTIDYIVDQSNTDKWNGIVGANWDITRRWSILVEYNGFFGSRDSIFAAVGWRF